MTYVHDALADKYEGYTNGSFTNC